MPGTNLTREEAQTRAGLLSVESYSVDLDLTVSDKVFESTTVLRFTCSEPGASTFADLVGATIHEVVLNGEKLDAFDIYRDSRIRLDDLQADNELRVFCELPYSHTGEGLHRFVDPADGKVYLYSQFEVPDARRVFTTFEQPDLKSTFTFTVTAPSHWVVVSNAPTPAPEEVTDSTSVWRFPTTKRMSTYITALIAGEYHGVHDTYEGKNGTIPLGHYCRQSLVDHLDRDEVVKITKEGFEFFEEAFDFPYPFEKYDQLYVPEYNMGAMENAGAVTLRDEYLPRSRQDGSFYEFRASVILHEMAHMWFGDLVTMKWWDDLWLNESFAEWACYHAAVQNTVFTESWTGFTNARKNWALRQDQLPSTHPIAADNHDLQAVEVNFDGITYAKGASVLKQLVAWVGLDAFIAGLRQYFKDHAYANSEFTDLLTALEKSSGRELDSWAKEWLQTVGREHAQPGVRARRRRRVLLVPGAPDRCGRLPDAASPPHRRRPLRPRRRPPRPSQPRRGRHRGRADLARGARRPAPARPAAAQRRRPDVRQDPPRRALAGHRRERPVAAGRLARAGPVLGRRVGHDPRRRDDRDGLRRARAGQHRRGDRRVRRRADPRVRRPGGRTSSPPRPTGPRCWTAGSRVSATC